MSKEMKYPIKYAILEIKEKSKISLNHEENIQGFIVSKCFVVESNVIYFSDGNFKERHKVVFPFKDIALFKTSLRNGKYNIGEKVVPKYDSNVRVYPTDEVTLLFDSYEQAKAIATKKNNEHKQKLFFKSRLSRGVNLSNWKEKFEIFSQEFELKLDFYELFEKFISDATIDMNITITTSEPETFVKVLKPINSPVKS